MRPLLVRPHEVRVNPPQSISRSMTKIASGRSHVHFTG